SYRRGGEQDVSSGDKLAARREALASDILNSDDARKTAAQKFPLRVGNNQAGVIHKEHTPIWGNLVLNFAGNHIYRPNLSNFGARLRRNGSKRVGQTLGFNAALKVLEQDQ